MLYSEGEIVKNYTLRGGKCQAFYAQRGKMSRMLLSEGENEKNVTLTGEKCTKLLFKQIQFPFVSIQSKKPFGRNRHPKLCLGNIAL